MPKPQIMVAPNGARKSKADHPALPLHLDEIIHTAQTCQTAGADALHLHIRDKTGAHSLDPFQYQDTLDALAEAAPELRVQITTEAAGRFDVPAQLHCLTQLAPAWASISVREIARSPDLASKLYDTCAANGTEVQHILYDTADIALLRDWLSQGIIKPHQSAVLFVLGRYSAAQTSTPSDLAPFRAALPKASDWMVCAFGPQEHACLQAAASQGGDLRVGFENSLTNAAGQPHTDNAASVAAVRNALKG